MSASIRRTVAVVGSVLGAALLSLPPIAGAVDVPVTPKKLVVVTKGSKAKTVFVAKDPAITKGGGTNVNEISVVFLISYDGEEGIFVALEGAHDGTRGWVVNKETVAKYADKAAPTVGDTKVALVKPGKLLKLVAKGAGDEPLDIVGQGAPTGLVHALYLVTNGGVDYLHCMKFEECVYKPLAEGTGAKLLCKNGAPDPLCGADPMPCGDLLYPTCYGTCPPGTYCAQHFSGTSFGCQCATSAQCTSGFCLDVVDYPCDPLGDPCPAGYDCTFNAFLSAYLCIGASCPSDCSCPAPGTCLAGP